MSWMIERDDGTFFLGSPVPREWDENDVRLFGGETEGARYDNEERAQKMVSKLRDRFDLRIQVIQIG